MHRDLTLEILSAFIHLSILSGLTIASTPPPASSPAPQLTVSLGYATYSGIPFFDTISNTINTHFLGVRYAASPTGSLRWAAPQPPRTTLGVQKAADQPLQCWQSPPGAATRSPFRDASANETASARALGSRKVLENGATPGASEDCLFLKYVHFLSCKSCITG